MSENGPEHTKPNGTDAKKNAEPSELDPCMEDSKNKRNSNIFYRYRDEVSAKSGLSHKGVYIVSGIVILTILLVIVVIALSVSWPRIPHKYQYPICQEVECLRASAQIRESLNSSVSPCDDLWTSVCGGWLKRNPLPRDKSVWNQKQQLLRNEAERVRDLIATFKQPLHIGTVEYKLKHLYEACMDVQNVNSEDATPLTKIIGILGGWYILRNFNEEDFDKHKLLINLHVKYGVTPFFKISVEPHPNMPGHNAIRIAPSGLGLPDKEYYYTEEDERIQVAYKEYIRDVIIYLSTARNEATKFGIDMFSYEKRIAEITPDTVTLQNPITTYNAISLSELKQSYLIPFFEIIQAMYPDSNISESTEVIVTSLEYLGHVSQIMSTTDRKTMNGYLIWTLVRSVVPYLSSTFTSAVDSFNSELFGIQQPLERWEMCTRLVTQSMGFAVDDLLSKKFPVTENTARVINDTFNSIVQIITRKLDNLQTSSLLHSYLQSKLSSLSLQIGNSGSSFTPAFLKEYYNSLTIMKLDFFESVKNGMVFPKKVEEKLLQNKIPNTWQSYNLVEEAHVKYFPSEHTLFIPRNLLSEPFFNENFTSSILYGRLGIEIAEALVSSVLPYGSLWTSDKKILSPYHTTVNDSLKSIQLSKKCLSNYILNLNLAIPFGTVNETSVRTLIHLTAIDVAKEALLLKTSQTAHIHQPSLEEYEDMTLFFLVYSQTQCSESTSQYNLYKDIVNFELPQRSRLHLIWTQLADYADSFGCSFNKKLQCPRVF